MKILYDYQAFVMQKFGGVSRCFAELVKHLPLGVDFDLGVRESDNAYIQDIAGVKPLGYKFQHFICNYNFKGKWQLHKLYEKIIGGHYYPNYNHSMIVEALDKGNYDIFHPTFFNDYFLQHLKGKPFVLTIHDMIPEKYPQYFPRDDFQIIKKRKLAKLANAIIAVSENTKKDIIDILNITEEKIHVVYHGCSFPVFSNPKKLIEKPYILHVGTRNLYKNFNLFIKHSLPFLRNHPDIIIVCTGPSFSGEESKILSDYKIEDRVIHYWAQTDEELFSLYHNAICFAYPSEYEGFGIPILEAYTSECPVLLNRSSCFPEIAGDAAVYFKMDDKSSNICEKLEYINSMSNDEKRELLNKQKKRLKMYSWEKSAKQLSDVYKSLM